MTEVDFLATGYAGLQTGILAITAIFTLLFAYMSGLNLFLRSSSKITKTAVYIMFLGTFLFLNLFLYSASLFGQEWLDLRLLASDEKNADGGFYASNSVAIMRAVWSIIALATIVFVTIETFRKNER